MEIESLRLAPEDIKLIKGSGSCAFCIPIPELYLKGEIKIPSEIYPQYENADLQFQRNGFVECLTLKTGSAVQIYIDDGCYPPNMCALSEEKKKFYGRNNHYAIHNVGTERTALLLIKNGIDILNRTLDYISRNYSVQFNDYLEESGLTA